MSAKKIAIDMVNFAAQDLARVLIAVILLCGTFALLLSGRDVPVVLWTLDGSAITFYFAVGIAKNVS